MKPPIMNFPYHFKSLVFVFACMFFLNQESRAQQNSGQLEAVIHDWYTSVSKGDIEHFSNLLTEDFQLMAFGSRFDTKQMLEMSSHFSNISEGSGEDIAYITFDIEMKFDYDGKPDVGRAMETYLFKKIGDDWKVRSKMIVLIEERK